MAALVLLERPYFRVNGATYDDAEIWDFLNQTGLVYTTTPPLVELKYEWYIDPNDSRGYNPNSNTRKWPDKNNHPAYIPISVKNATLPDDVFIFLPMREPYYGYGVSEDYFTRWFFKGSKFLGLRIRAFGTVEFIPFGPISGGFSIGRDFLPGAVAVVALAVGLHAVGDAIIGAGTISGAGGETIVSGGALPGAGGATLTDWEIATGGMGTGMGTAADYTIANVVADAGAVLKTGQDVLVSTAKILTTAATVQAAVTGPQTPAPPAAVAPPAENPGNVQANGSDGNSTMILGVLAAVALLAS